jgi:hypothetical protein
LLCKRGWGWGGHHNPVSANKDFMFSGRDRYVKKHLQNSFLSTYEGQIAKSRMEEQ